MICFGVIGLAVDTPDFATESGFSKPSKTSKLAEEEKNMSYDCDKASPSHYSALVVSSYVHTYRCTHYGFNVRPDDLIASSSCAYSGNDNKVIKSSVLSAAKPGCAGAAGRARALFQSPRLNPAYCLMRCLICDSEFTYRHRLQFR
ncbi:hypothetical protein EVAR_5975_1 [Eumeta japonica]|uniref:Uncharacterized protein n=1 Tax=Eumeta variegata TaxID=151549 RepID=A0A4C1T9E0_EUMVA|nr:hypothetical protein EVAR_5975_1 [Eumeta japonica]